VLKEAERELAAATKLADLNEAAKKLMRAKEALKPEPSYQMLFV
jgi:hypothetical protein